MVSLPLTSQAPEQGPTGCSRDDIELAPAIPAKVVAKQDDPFLVTFTASDPENPLNWSSGRKWAVTDVLSATGFNRIMVSTIMAPALPLIAQELDMSPTESAMSLSIYLLATAFGPLFLGPLSEIYGRTRVLHASNIWFLVWNIACGFATTKELLIGGRFLAGFGASAIYSLAGGVLGDVWRPEQRGKSLSMYLLIPLLGSAVGPIIGGFMAGRTTWRWMFWSTSIFQAVMTAVSFTTFQETYAPYLLKKKAESLRRQTGDVRYQTVHERLHAVQVKAPSVLAVLARALSRPFRLLAFHPIIQLTAICSAFEYGVLYIVLSSFADLWTQHYGVSTELSGLHYLAVAFGELMGSLLGAPLMDRLYVYMRNRTTPDAEHVPEYRIPLTFLGRSLNPIGLFIYGWTAQYHTHWAAVDTGIFISMFFAQIGGMPMSAYVMDAYADHTSSALAATQFLRSLTAFLFPLFAPSMYAAMGYGWGNSMLAFFSLLIGLPASWLIWKYGAKLRAKALSSY